MKTFSFGLKGFYFGKSGAETAVDVESFGFKISMSLLSSYSQLLIKAKEPINAI